MSILLFLSILLSVFFFGVAQIQKMRADAQTRLAEAQKMEADIQRVISEASTQEMQRLRQQLDSCRGK
jgi:hypothetical protein